MALEATFIFRMRGDRCIGTLFCIVAAPAMAGDAVSVVIPEIDRNLVGDAWR
jgi:hypothetical protein